MSKRNEIQDQALAAVIPQKRSGLAISMGVGKTLIGLRFLDHHYQNGLRRFLVVAPKVSIYQSWKDDAARFGYEYLLSEISFTTYLSLVKQDTDYSVLVLDECHSLLSSHLTWLAYYPNTILGLTGTPPRYQDSEKGLMVKRFCPIVYKYITDDAVDDRILNDYRITVHMLNLSRAKTFPVNTKNGGTFFTSELDNYVYWSNRIKSATTKKEEQICSVMRMRAMMDYRTKENYAHHLLEDISQKCIVFANTQDQADRLCAHSYHSTNPNAEQNLRYFKEGKILHLSCVLQLSEGVTIPNLGEGIILHAYGNERKSNQRIGRLLRLSPDAVANIHILSYKDTVDLNKWVPAALADLDEEKIQYVEPVNSLI